MSPVSSGARVGDPQRVASGTDAGTNFHVTLPATRCGSQSRAPGQCVAVPRRVRRGKLVNDKRGGVK